LVFVQLQACETELKKEQASPVLRSILRV
jgi:hypothetical protein